MQLDWTELDCEFVSLSVNVMLTADWRPQRQPMERFMQMERTMHLAPLNKQKALSSQMGANSIIIIISNSSSSSRNPQPVKANSKIAEWREFRVDDNAQ